jgi:hypothetical protein
MTATAPLSALRGKVRLVNIIGIQRARQTAICLLICGLSVQSALSDTVTYQHLKGDISGRAITTAPIPAAARTTQPVQDPQGQNQPQAPRATESPNRPEFVRLPDGRIVRYGPGVVCDENCVAPVAPIAFRGEGPGMWWFIPPVAAGVILCIVLCGGDNDNGSPQPTPTIVIPTPTPSTSPQPTPTTSPGPTPQPSVSPSVGPTPPPNEIPEPGTIVLVGLGLGAMLARRRRKDRKDAGC